MRMNHMSLNRKWILFSLVLLSPAILAAENLNFNYTRADALSLEPQLGLQAKACHSKADPMDIHVRFDKNVNMGRISGIQLEINGSAYVKSYTIFSPSVKSRASLDPDFLVPWGAHAKGSVNVNETNNVYIPEVPEKNDGPFCFSNDGPRFWSVLYPPRYSVGGLLPIFRDPPYYFDPLGQLTKKDFDEKCQPFFNKIPDSFKNDIMFYWPYGSDFWEHLLIKPEEIARRTGSSYIYDKIKAAGKNALIVKKSGNIFFTYHTDAQPARTEQHSTPQKYDIDSNCTADSCSFYFPTGNGKDGNIIQNGSEFLIKLNNRNIKSMKLTVTNGLSVDDWVWRLENDSYSNNLNGTHHFGGPSVLREPVLRTDDPYNIAGFYMKKNPGFYSGTLIARSALNTTYTDFVNKVTPLSLPASAAGNINLVNTDSLIFTFGAGSNNAPTLSIFGQPLKFAPLSVNGKEVASAMDVRNACY